MSIKFDKKLLDWAIQLENEANCDISAGIDLGQDVDQYLEYILNSELSSYDRVLNLFQQKLGTKMSQEEIESLASECLQIVSTDPKADKSIAA